MLTRSPGPPGSGETVELTTERFDPEGSATGRLGTRRVRVRGALPGERVRARVRKRRRGRLEAEVVEVLAPSPDRVEPRCAHFGICGGCRFQHLSYRAQLDELGRRLSERLAAVAPSVAVEPVIACDDPWRYRNKMDFTFGSRRFVEPGEPEGVEQDFALGLHVRGRFDKVLDVGRCEIAFAEAPGIVGSARRLARELLLEPWDVRAHTGLLRHLVLRKSFASGEILASLVTTGADSAGVARYAAAILAEHPEITTLVHLVNPGAALVAVGEEEVLHGSGLIEERVGGLRFAVSAASFFQTNTAQAERLLAEVRTQAAPFEGGVLFDLYCGGGLFGLGLAGAAREVLGFEISGAAVADAEANARRNGVANARFQAGDLAATLEPESLVALGAPPPSLCVVDPPRAGVDPRVLRSLDGLRPRALIYVSCNPAAAVRDLGWFLGRGYGLRRVQPIDLFPHTPHLECVFTLAREGS